MSKETKARFGWMLLGGLLVMTGFVSRSIVEPKPTFAQQSVAGATSSSLTIGTQQNLNGVIVPADGFALMFGVGQRSQRQCWYAIDSEGKAHPVKITESVSANDDLWTYYPR